MSIILKRLHGFNVNLTALHEITAQSTLNQLLERYHQSKLPGSDVFDISNCDNEQVYNLTCTILSKNKNCIMFWASDVFAVSATGQFIISNITDLWLPSSDDVLVVDEKFNLLFGIDHEGKMSIFVNIKNVQL